MSEEQKRRRDLLRRGCRAIEQATTALSALIPLVPVEDRRPQIWHLEAARLHKRMITALLRDAEYREVSEGGSEE